MKTWDKYTVIAFIAFSVAFVSFVYLCSHISNNAPEIVHNIKKLLATP